MGKKEGEKKEEERKEKKTVTNERNRGSESALQDALPSLPSNLVDMSPRMRARYERAEGRGREEKRGGIKGGRVIDRRREIDA